MKTIKYLGGIHALAKGEEDIYLGSDGATTINLSVAEETNVSDEKAAQLAADFPGRFEIDGKTAGKRTSKLELVQHIDDVLAEQTATDDVDTETDGETQPEAETDGETETETETDVETETESDEAAADDHTDDDLAGQLMVHSRAELNAAAKKLKIKDPDKLPNKAAVVDAIVAAKKADAA